MPSGEVVEMNRNEREKDRAVSKRPMADGKMLLITISLCACAERGTYHDLSRQLAIEALHGWQPLKRVTLVGPGAFPAEYKALLNVDAAALLSV
jgi:hypothetical protein